MCFRSAPDTSLFRSEAFRASHPPSFTFTEEDEALCCLDPLKCYQITMQSSGSLGDETGQAFVRAPDPRDNVPIKQRNGT
jgi:hypothetical protein